MSLSTNTEAKWVLVKVMMPRLCLLFLLLISSLAVAEKYALLVGINDYQGDISPLRYCVADVEAFGQALVETAGFKSDNVYLMTSQMTGRHLEKSGRLPERLAKQGSNPSRSWYRTLR